MNFALIYDNLTLQNNLHKEKRTHTIQRNEPVLSLYVS